MHWFGVVLVVALVIQFSFIGWMAWHDRDAYKGQQDDLRNDPSRASWTSSAMQNDMQGGE